MQVYVLSPVVSAVRLMFHLDDWFVITVTDANFGRYNITPEYITRTMAKFPRVNNAVVCLGDGLEVGMYVPFLYWILVCC